MEFGQFNLFDGLPLSESAVFHPDLFCHIVLTPPEIVGWEGEHEVSWSGFYVTATRFDGGNLSGADAAIARKLILKGMKTKNVAGRYYISGPGSEWRGGRGRSRSAKWEGEGLQTIDDRGNEVSRTSAWAALAYRERSESWRGEKRWTDTSRSVEDALEAMQRMMKTSAWGAVALSFDGEEKWWHDHGWAYKLADFRLCGASSQHVFGYEDERADQPDLYENDAIVAVGVPHDDDDRHYDTFRAYERKRIEEGPSRYTRYYVKCVPNDDVDRMVSNIQAMMSGAFGFPLPDLQG